MAADRLSLGGLISGVSTEDLIARIMEAERFRVTREEMKKMQLEEQQAAWREIKSSLESLRSSLDTIRFASFFRSRKAALTDETVAEVTVTAGVTLTTHTLTVNTLAQAHVVAGNSDQTDANAALGVTGTLTINGKSITLVGTDTLNSIRDKINTTAGIGVTADVVKVQVSGQDRYRLVLTAEKQGTANAITIDNTTAAQSLGFVDGTGTLINEVAAARDATFTLDGIAYTQPDNVVDDVIPGLSITLKKDGGAQTNITVEQDTDAMAKGIEDWAEQLNKTLELITEYTKYDEETKTAGLLQGDSLARRIQTNLRSMLSTVVSGLPSDLNQLSHVGVTTGAWGTDDYGKVLVDTAKLKEKLLEDPDGVARLFGALRTNVALQTNGATATASSTAPDTATNAYDPNDVINGDIDSDRFGTAGGGWESEFVPSDASPEYIDITFNGTKTIDQIRLYLPDNATYSMAASGLRNYRLLYKDTSGTWQEIEAVTDNTTAFKTFDFEAVQAQAVRLEVTATWGTNNPARVTEIEVHEVTNAPVPTMYGYLDSTLDYTGAVETRDDAYDDRIKEIDSRIERLNDYLERREEILRRQFARMEEAVARMQQQGAFLAMQMMGLQAKQQ